MANAKTVTKSNYETGSRTKVHPHLITKGQIFSVATSNIQIFDQQSQKDKCINSIQKQYIYIIENTDCF